MDETVRAVHAVACVRACSRLSLRVYCVLIRLCDARRWPTWMSGPSGDPPFGLFRSPLPWKLDAPGTGTLPDRFHNLSPFNVSRYLWDARGCRSGGRLVHKETLLWETTKISQTVRIKQQPKANAGREVAKQPRCRWGVIARRRVRVRFVARSGERVKNLPEDTPKDQRCSARAPRESLALAPRAILAVAVLHRGTDSAHMSRT